jgi:hypothetical protein
MTKNVRNLLIGFALFLATIQCVRSIYGYSVSTGDWHLYVVGKDPMPYQGRIGMMPYLRWAEGSPLMHRLSDKYEAISKVGNKMAEPVTVDKFASLLASLASLLIMVAAASWYSVRSRYRPWWLMPVLVLIIVTFTLAVKTESNYWFVYDLPHAALFGLASICILEGWWAPLLVLFVVDSFVRETSLYLVVLFAALFGYRQDKKGRIFAGLLTAAMAIYWVLLRLAIQRRFAHNANDVGSHLSKNLHTILLPHHWPQLFSAGAYLVVFVWLERKRLPLRQQVFLWAALLCVPITLYFGVWVETRIWLEWTLPLAVLASSEWSQYSSTAAKEFAVSKD